MPKKKDSRLAKAGVSGYNKPKRTPNHKTKSHVVVAKVGVFGANLLKQARAQIRSKRAKARPPRPNVLKCPRLTTGSPQKGHGSAAGANLLKFGLVGPPQKGHGSAAGANLLKSGLRADQIC